MQTYRVQVAQRGLITLPQSLRKEYAIEPGQELTLIDWDGVFMLSRGPSRLDALADRIADELAARGETLETVLTALREVRAEYE